MSLCSFSIMANTSALRVTSPSTRWISCYTGNFESIRGVMEHIARIGDSITVPDCATTGTVNAITVGVSKATDQDRTFVYEIEAEQGLIRSVRHRRVDYGIFGFHSRASCCASAIWGGVSRACSCANSYRTVSSTARRSKGF